MNLNHEVNMYRARVAFVSKVPSAEFTDEENLMLENMYHYGSPVEDAADSILYFRNYPVKETAENE